MICESRELEMIRGSRVLRMRYESRGVLLEMCYEYIVLDMLLLSFWLLTFRLSKDKV